jgi:hypothetical protein
MYVHANALGPQSLSSKVVRLPAKALSAPASFSFCSLRAAQEPCSPSPCSLSLSIPALLLLTLLFASTAGWLTDLTAAAVAAVVVPGLALLLLLLSLASFWRLAGRGGAAARGRFTGFNGLLLLLLLLLTVS